MPIFKKQHFFELEPRIMFDAAGAAVVEANAEATNTVDSNENLDQSVSPVVAMYSESVQKMADKVSQTYQEALAAIGQFVQNDESLAQMREIFQSLSAEISSEQLESLRTQILDGTYSIQIKILDAQTMGIAKGAYADVGPDGTPIIYINGDWAEGADTAELQQVMVEEIGHSFDTYLNGTSDSAGDEGQRFAILVNGTFTDLVGMDNDHYTMTVDGVMTHVELANFNFVNAYSMVYDLDNDTTSKTFNQITTGDIDTTERWADKEQNSHYFNTASLGSASIDDTYNSTYFSGNDVSAIGINIGGTTYYGWVSRPIKAGGVVRGFYFWTDNDFVNITMAQNDGNSDGDRNVIDNKGFLLVVDQAWFDAQIASKTQYTINNTKDGNLGSIWVSNVGSSSDRVDSALNSLIVPNSAPTAVNDTVTIAEGATATGNVLTNDSDPNGDSLTITGFSINGTPGTVGQATTITGVGTITINANGSYTFTPNLDYNGTVPPITYTESDGTASSTATLSITVTPVNDAPISTDNSITTSENTPKVLTLNDFGTYSDPENDPLTKIQITQLATNGTLQYWNGSAWSAVTLNQEITVTQILQGFVRFTPDTNESGNNYATVTFKVSDGQTYSATSNTLTVNVTAGNQAPVANADTNSVAEEGCSVPAAPATGNLIAGGTADSDANGGTLSVTDITAYGDTRAVTAGTTSANGTTINGQYGTLIVGADGSYSYVLNNALSAIDMMNSGDSKTETFSYTLSDGQGGTATTTITITINGTNDALVATDDFSTFIEETNASAGNHGTVTGNALTNDTDIDNNSLDLTISLTDGTAPSNNPDIVVSASSPISAVTLSITAVSGSWTAIVPTSPAQPVWLDAARTIAALDRTGAQLTVYRSGSGGSATLVFSDNIALYDIQNTNLYIKDPGNSNMATVSVVITSATTSSSTTISTISDVSTIQAGYEVSGSGIPVGTTVISVNTSNKTIILSQSVNFANSSITFHDPNSLTITGTQEYFQGTYGYLILNESGSYTYTLTSDLSANQVVEEQFTYHTRDTAGCTDSAIIKIRVTGVDAPKLANDTLVVAEDSGNHISLNATSPGSGSVSTNDVAGTSISLNNVTSFKVAGDNTIYISGTDTATISGVGTLFIAANGAVTFNPVDDYVGPVPTITYTRLGSDSQSYTANLTITIQSSDDASVLTADIKTIDEDSTATGNVLTNDTDNDSTLSVASYTWNNGTGISAGTIDSSTPIIVNSVTVGALTLNSNGSYTFTPTADWNGNVPQITYTTNTGSTSTLDITVTPINDAPMLDLDNSGTGTGFSTTYTNAGSAVSIGDIDVFIADIDDTNMESATIVLTNPQSGDSLTVGSLPAGISVASGPTLSGGVMTLTLSGSASLADYQSAIKAITFSSTGTSTADRVVSVRVNDGTLDSNTAYTIIDVSPDSRSLSVTGTTVNESSPYVMFEVTGAENQWISLALEETSTGHDATMGTDFLPNLQYYNGTAWVNYTGENIQIPDTAANDGKLLVRTAVLQDTAYEGAETLKLTATNQAGTAASGNSTIIDDGTGDVYLGTNTSFITNISTDGGYPTNLDDDRPVTVNSIVVNEGSPYAIFTLAGYSGQLISINLNDQSATEGNSATDGSDDFGGTTLQYWDGSAWQDYNGTSVAFSGTTLYVRTTIYQDTLFEGQEAFNLAVTKLSSNTTIYGTCSIYDDGTGTKYDGTFTGGNPTTSTNSLDDDRTISINNITVNEGSDYAIFTVAGNSGQTATLSLTEEIGASKANILEAQTLKVWDGLDWVDYDSGNLPTFDANGKIYVRVDIIQEQDAPYEGSETFKLNVTVTGQAVPETGIATIKDDGTGVKYDGTFTGGNPTTSTSTLDNDTPAGDNAPVISGNTSGTGNEDGGAITGTLSATDADGLTDGTYFTVTGTAAHGTATINAATGVWSYTPNADWNGSDSFTVTLTDDLGNTATQVISMTVNPIADIQNDTATTNEDTAVTTNVLTNDTFEGTPVITSVTNGSHGTVTIIDASAGTVQYTPDANWFGTDTYTYTVTSGGVTETATVTVTISSAGTVTIIDASAGTVQYTPDVNWFGTDTYTYTVTSGGVTETATVTVKVNEVLEPYIPEITLVLKSTSVELLNTQEQTIEADMNIIKTLDQLQEQDDQSNSDPIQKEMQYVEETYNNPSQNEDPTGIQVNNTGRVVLEFAGQHETTQMNVVEVRAFQMDPNFVRIVVKDTQYKEGDAKFEIFALDGTEAPEWLKIDPSTGVITGVPPKGIEKVVVQVKIIGKDGKIKTVDVEINVVKKNITSIEGTLSNRMNHFASQYRSSDELISILNKTAKGA